MHSYQRTINYHLAYTDVEPLFLNFRVRRADIVFITIYIHKYKFATCVHARQKKNIKKLSRRASLVSLFLADKRNIFCRADLTNSL